MLNKTISNVGMFLAGVGVGSAVGILFAPKSGDDTREAVRETVQKGTDYIQDNARQVFRGAEEVIRRGSEVVLEQKERIAAAIDVGREAYQREKARAQSV
jgi:gas vesicle protein